MNQVANTVMLPREEYDSLVQQRDELIKQQAARIAELEAERDNLKAYSMHERSLGAELGMMEAHQARQELADLRKRIDDAPVVAYVRYEVGIRPTFVPVINGKCEVSPPKLAEFTQLISKEDLK